MVAFTPGRQHQAPEAVVGSAKVSSTTSTALWVFGLLTASGAITVAVCVPPPPPGLHKNAYFLAISCFFFAGVAGVMSAVVCVATTTHRDRDGDTTGRKLIYVLLARLASVGAVFRTTTALGVIGLATVSTAITLAVCVPPPALHKNAYFLAISCFFFAGVAGIMSAVFFTATTTTTHLRHRHATRSWSKVMHVLLRPQLASVGGGAAFSTKTALGLLGLAAASTAMNLPSSVCQPHQPPRVLDKSDYYYHLAISGVFFAGVAAWQGSWRP